MYPSGMSNTPWFPVLPEWFARGACVGRDPSLFEPSATNATSTAPWRGICQSCPIREFCLEYAVDNETYGNWGGLTSNERKQLKRLETLTSYQYPSPELSNDFAQVQVFDELDIEYVQSSQEIPHVYPQIEVKQLVQDIDRLLASI